MKIINITNPTVPMLAGSLNLDSTSCAFKVTIIGNYLYITMTGRNTELQIINISNPADLQSIAISSNSLGLVNKSTQQFTAIGTNLDGSTQDITNLVTWNSSNPAVAAFNVPGTPGLTTALAVGTTDITATLEGITSPSQTLTVIDISQVTDARLLHDIAGRSSTNAATLLAIARNLNTNIDGLRAIVAHLNVNDTILEAVAAHHNADAHLLLDIARR